MKDSTERISINSKILLCRLEICCFLEVSVGLEMSSQDVFSIRCYFHIRP